MVAGGARGSDELLDSDEMPDLDELLDFGEGAATSSHGDWGLDSSELMLILRLELDLDTGVLDPAGDKSGVGGIADRPGDNRGLLEPLDTRPSKVSSMRPVSMIALTGLADPLDSSGGELHTLLGIPLVDPF